MTISKHIYTLFPYICNRNVYYLLSFMSWPLLGGPAGTYGSLFFLRFQFKYFTQFSWCQNPILLLTSIWVTVNNGLSISNAFSARYSVKASFVSLFPINTFGFWIGVESQHEICHMIVSFDYGHVSLNLSND